MTGNLTRPPAAAGTPAPDMGLFERYARELGLASRLVVLVLSAALAVPLMAWSWSLTAHPFRFFDGILSPPGVEALRPSLWLTWGHAAITSLFLVTNLVCRRYGPGWALVQVVLSTLAAAIALVTLSPEFAAALAQQAAQFTGRELVSLLVALGMGQAVSVYVFEHTRGVEWWNAPAYAALTASLVSMPLFYALAYFGSDWVWLNRMSIDIALKALMAFALLVPYYLLRPVVRPLEGYGGY